MKRSLFLGMVIGVVFSLALPLHLMAQTTPLKLVIETSSGDRIGGAQIQSFSLAPDNTLIINVGNSGFDFQALLPDISIVAPCTNCNITALASVSAVVGNQTISFSLFSNTLNTIFSLKVNPDKQDPASAGVIGTAFSWNIGGATPVASGAYLAVFEATDGTHTSQLPVTITINPPITVTAPTSVTGPTTGSVNVTNSFTASGAITSQQGDTVQYQFDWKGDGSDLSQWGSATQSKTWTAVGGPYTIRARAASVAYPSVQSGWTTGPAITITNAPPPPTAYSLTINVSPAGAGTVTVGGVPYSSVITNLSGSQLLYINATPSGTTPFSSWTVVSGGALIGSSTSASTSVTMQNANAVITANFSGSTPPPSGWLPLNTRIGTTSFFGYNLGACSQCGAQDFLAAGGTAYKFIIDPIAAEAIVPGTAISGKPILNVADRNQAIPCSPITLSVLDANGGKILSVPMSGGNASYTSLWPKTFIYQGQRLLLELTPSASMSMLIYWSMQ